MNPVLKGVVAVQGGLFARHQALSAGYTRKEFEWMIRRDGPWSRVRYGIYAQRDVWRQLDDLARARLLDRAALLVCDTGTVLSHSSAARALGLPVYAMDDGLAHATRLRYHDRVLTRIVAGIKHHGGRLTDEEIVETAGLRTTSLVRTVLDVTSEFGYHSGLVVADAAMRRGVARADLEHAVELSPHDPHVSTRRAVVATADERAETPIETLGRTLLIGMGITDVVPQEPFEFRAESDAAVDLYSPRLRHIFECDGKLKYRTQTNWRGDTLTADDVVWLEKKREDRLRGRGLGFSRLVWSDVQPDAFNRVSARLWSEIRSQNASGLFPPAGRST